MDYAILASANSIKNASEALTEHGLEAHLVATKEEALSMIKELIPRGASVMNGSSRTLEEIGFIEYLKSGEHGWSNLHEGIISEKDPARQEELRKQSVVSDYYLGSVHALSETGEILIASNTGSQLPHVVYTSPNIIFVVGTQKITPSLEAAFQRLDEYVVPLEDRRMHDAYGMGTMKSKVLIFFRENLMVSRRKVRVILVNQKLGF